jgi:hypothetical protein
MSKRALDIHLRRLETALAKQEESLTQLKARNRERETQFEKNLASCRAKIEEVRVAADEYKDTIDREAKRRERELLREIERLKKLGGLASVEPENFEGLEKAKTLAIFDSILFGIENWSADGQIASDITMVSQSVLFPTVYERVMKGNEDYFIEKVPTAAAEIVKRGREFVKHIRDVSLAPLSDPDAWESHAELVQQWWISDALPLIYGARDPDWEEDKQLKHVEIMEWRDMPASRALDFPLIFDGMELVDRYRDQIRESTGLPEFTKQTLSTRIEP